MNYLFNNSSTSVFSNPYYWLLGLFLFILIYLILREFKCWYLKTNKIIKLLEEIKKDLDTKKVLEKPQSINEIKTDVEIKK
jgi:hypothetical protein